MWVGDCGNFPSLWANNRKLWNFVRVLLPPTRGTTIASATLYEPSVRNVWMKG